MIKSLHITNYALIDEIDIDFAPGFNIITGETGAGKSIILGALSLLLGGRADTKAVRRGERKSVIEALFSLSDASGVEELIERNGLDNTMPGECLLRRELLPGGRSRAFVNDTPVNLSVLREIAERLVDIHSQQQNQQLASEQYQLDVIDSLADNAALLADYRKAYAAFREALGRYTDTRDMLRRNRDDAEYLTYQYEQLEQMKLQPGEHEELEKERDVLANATEIKENLAAALDPLTNGRPNVLEMLSAAVEAVENLADTLGADDGDSDYRVLAERLESARIEIQDITDSLADIDDGIAATPGRLEEVEERLARLYSLETKHHVDNADGLIALRDSLKKQIATLDDGDNVLHNLEKGAKRAKSVALGIARELSERREAAARAFAAELAGRAAPLGMPNLRCDVHFEKGKLGADGFDKVQFLFAFNKNQELLPVGGAASGGEVSRLMLTVKSIVAEHMKLPSIIFDEVDTGVSGDIAARMGAMMERISRFIQVVTITHLPGVAAMGRRHFKVFKEDDDDATTTRIRVLDARERCEEIALMISGVPPGEAAIANARALLVKAGNLDSEQ